MKSVPKFVILFFLIIFVIQLICLFLLWLAPAAGQAAGVQYKAQVELPGYTFNPSDTSTGNIANYVRAIYKYAIGIVGILAAVVLMIGGVMWIVAGGNATAIGEAKSWIGASLTGLVLALTSYLILATVNPALVDFKTTRIEPVKPSVSETNFDTATPCGQQLPGEKLICGSQCPTGQKCEKVPAGTAGAKDCMVGGDTFWLCSSISGGGTNCCNSTSSCASGYTCDTTVTYAQLTACTLANPQGLCRASAATSGGIQENQNCKGMENQCAAGLHCSSADNRCRPVNWESVGTLNDACGATTPEGYICKTADTILGIPKCPSGYTHYGFGGRSCSSSLMCCKKD